MVLVPHFGLLVWRVSCDYQWYSKHREYVGVSKMAWIFQGNPKIFDIDDYLARYPELIYWRVPRYQAEISVGDRAFVWRAGSDAGLVASGTIAEVPVGASDVKHPEALGDDLWYADSPDLEEKKVGIKLDSIRLYAEEGMVARTLIKDDSLLQGNPIIKMPNATVFRLNEDEHKRVEEIWSGTYEIKPAVSIIVATEGEVQLKAHRKRERSRFLVKKKLEDFRRNHGSLHCEVCQLSEAMPYPSPLSTSIFEVHHIAPLFTAVTPTRTMLADLAIVCANCHRAIHATIEAEENMKTIKRALAK